MKLLVTADVHIRNYSKFTKWNRVIPDRLKVNLDLAKDIVSIAEQESVDTIIIAGDLLDIAVSPPMVLNVVDKFLSIISDQCPIYLTHGQHDLSTKTVDEFLKQLTSLSIFENDRIHFIHDEVVALDSRSDLISDKVKAYFYGWSSEAPKFQDADIFIGHGCVSGSKNVLGYIFQTGYDPLFLSQKYKFSVVGDIHQSQVFYDNVLIPGPPIQNSFKDSPDTGVWVINTDNWSYKFCPLTSDEYPKFFYVSSKSEIPKDKNENHHYQVLSYSRQKETTSQISNVSDSLDLWNIIQSTIQSIKDSRQESLLKIAKTVYDEGLSCKVDTRFLPQVLVKKVSIKNFFSIKDLELEIPEGTVSIIGDIGSGKSTLLEAICYGFYGVTTKGKFKDDIAPVTYDYTEDPEVSVEYSIGDSSYKIIRGMSFLKFEINETPVSGSRMADTQKLIEDTIQLSYSEFSCLVYFSQESGSFFGSLKNDQQMSLMTMFLSQQDQYLNKMISSVSSSYKKYMGETLKIEGSIESLDLMNTKNLHKYNQLKSQEVSLRDRQIEALSYSPFKDCPVDVVDLLIQDKVTEALNMYFNIDYQKLLSQAEILRSKKSDLSSQKLNLEISLTTSKSELKSKSLESKTLLGKIKAYKSGICPECRQSLPVDESHLQSLVNDLKECKIRINTLEDQISKESEILSRITDHLSVFEEKLLNIQQLLSKCDLFVSKKQSETAVNHVELKVLKDSIDEYEVQKHLLEKQKLDYKELYELYEILHKKVFTDKAIKSKCVEFVGQNLSNEVNSLLESIDSNLRMTINTVTYNKSGGLSAGFDVIGDFNGVGINYRNASGGQKMLMDVSAIISIYNLLSSMYNLPHGIFGFLAMDESIRYLDSKNIDTVRDLIGCIRSKLVFIVSHDEKLSQSLTDKYMLVKLENGVSNYRLV